MNYDVVVVGAGLFGCTVARRCADAGKRVLVLEASDEIGGNCFIESDGTHRHGPHLFHTNSKEAWNWMARFQPWHQYQHRVLSLVDSVPVSVPFCMHTFRHFWGCTTIREARHIIEKETSPYRRPHYTNAEAYGLGNFGPTLYEKMIMPYTVKQWGLDPADVPASVIARIPLRFSWDDRYFTDEYQGVMDYGAACRAMLDGIDVKLREPLLPDEALKMGKQLVWSGRLDAFLRDPLPYRSLTFRVDGSHDDLGIGQLNTPSIDVTHTRIVQARHFGLHPRCPTTVFEYPTDEGHPYYPVEDRRAEEARKIAESRGVILGGRLGSHQYFNMDQVICQALKKAPV